jgi:hypothetical protein
MTAREWRERVPHANGTRSRPLDQRERRTSCLTRRVPRMVALPSWPMGAARGEAALDGSRHMLGMPVGAEPEPGWGCTMGGRRAERMKATARTAVAQ